MIAILRPGLVGGGVPRAPARRGLRVAAWRWATRLLLAMGLPFAHAQADVPLQPFVEVVASPAQLKQLRAGGFSLYMRHGTTDNSQADRVPLVDLADCSSQRPLTEEGRKLAARIGQSIARAAIPIGEIRISPLCRVKETAAAAFPGKPVVIDERLMYVANLTTQQKAPIIAHTRDWLARPVPAGSNRLLIGHAPNLMELIGYFPKEGTLVIFQPDAAAPRGFTYVASIPPAAWADLLR